MKTNNDRELLKEAIDYTCRFLTFWELHKPETYSGSYNVSYMNDFLKKIEDSGDKELMACINSNLSK